MKERITKATHTGKACTYHGYDGKDYVGKIAQISGGVAVVHYELHDGTGPITAYVERPDHDRRITVN